MAPLAPDLTHRIYVDYQADDKKHVVMFRADASATVAGMLDAAQDLFTAASPLLTLTTILDVRAAAIGADFTVSIGLPSTITYGAGSGDDLIDATFVAWSGRSLTGRKTKLSLYGMKFLSAIGDFRQSVSTSAPGAAVRDVLNGTPGYFVAIDGAEVTWKPYINVGMNAYWQRKLRRV